MGWPPAALTPTADPAAAPGAPPADVDPGVADLQREGLRRLFLAARADPALYARLVFGFAPAWHHRVWLTRIAEALDDATAPERRRLCIVAPPGSAKTTCVSQWLPCHYLGAHPERSLLVVTASDTMARQHHLVVGQTLAESAAHRRAFPDPRARPAPSKGWSVDGLYLAGTPAKDPAYRAVGLGAHVLGSRCHVLLLDDCVTQEQAQSAVEMDRARRFLDQTLLSRLHPPPLGGAVVAVGTRWAEHDVISHLEGLGFEVLLFPQLSATYPWKAAFEREAPEQVDVEGRVPLWPARFPLAWVEQERARLGSAQFQLLHMGDPVTLGGQIFRSSEWFHPLPARFDQDTRAHLLRVTGVDLAWSSKETADYTVAATLGVDPRDPMRRLYLLHLFRQRLDEGELLPRLAEHLATVQPHAVGVEVGAFKGDATGVLVQQLRLALFGKLPHAPDVQGVRAVQDKVSRVRGLAVHAENGLFYVDREGLGPLWPIAERELLGMPLVAHDDVPDALALAANLALGNALARAQGPVRVRFG